MIRKTASEIPHSRLAPPPFMGRFRISAHLIRSNWQDVLPIFAEVVVIRCEMDFPLDHFEYTAISKHFSAVKIGERPPFYYAEMLSEDGMPPRFIRFVSQEIGEHKRATEHPGYLRT